MNILSLLLHFSLVSIFSDIYEDSSMDLCDLNIVCASL